ncbi:MAG: hypothetical protein HFH25_04045 [Lachnospiraceae bacterium]|nr:hypothetical protein [Lachnospiraceae bacterium]
MSEEPEKRMMENYEIIHSIWIGDKEVVFGQDESNDMPYFCAFYTNNALFESYSECVIGDDYVEMMELFSERVKEQCEKMREEQAKVTVPRGRIAAEICEPDNRSMDLRGKVAVIKAEALRPEYRFAEHQLVYVTGGSGAWGNSRGTTCFCENLYSGGHESWKRYDIQGTVKPELLPEWAKEKLRELQMRREGKENPDFQKEQREVVRE